MKEIGQLLKQTREAQGKSLEDISTLTKIQLPTLISLENGEFGKLANKAFIKGFIRQYAKALGLDANDLLSAYEKSNAGTPEPKPASVAKLDSDQLNEKTNLLWFRTPSQFITLGAIVIILVLITSIYFISIKIVSYSQETVRTESPVTEDETSSPPPVSELIQQPVSATQKEASNTETTAPTPGTTANSASSPAIEEEAPPPKGVAPATEAKQKLVAIEARTNVSIDAAWSTGKKETIQLTANNKHVFYYLEKIKLVVSDGGGVKISTHEKDLGIPGESGKPITINFH